MNCQEAKYKFIETKDITPKREKVSSEWRLFLKMILLLIILHVIE